MAVPERPVIEDSPHAYAANVYTVDGSTSPRGKGSANKPLPVSLNFGYTVQDENPANRGTPVEKYFIGAEGLMTYPEEFPTCSGGSDGANNQDLDTVKQVCRKARVGGGIIKAYAGAAQDPTQKLNCVLELNLYNCARTSCSSRCPSRSSTRPGSTRSCRTSSRLSGSGPRGSGSEAGTARSASTRPSGARAAGVRFR